MKPIRADHRTLTSHGHTVVLLVRHAETDAVGARIAGRVLDSALTVRGQTDAERLAADLREIPIAAIYASPRRRALETAAPLAARGIEVQVDTAFDEVDYGEWSGVTFDDLSRREDWHRYNEDRAASRIPAGEAPAATQVRVAHALAAVHRRHPAAVVAVVTHAEIVRYAVLLARARSLNDWHAIEIAPASVTPVVCSAAGVTDPSAVAPVE
jgi:broad specificity phosphatase PhoE